MFGVVVCPRCGRAKGVELTTKTTSCQCGFEIRVHPSRVRAQSATARELAGMVGRINAEIHGAPDDVQPIATKSRKRDRDAFARIVADANRAGDRRQKIREAAEGLAREFVLFSFDDWRRTLDALGVSNAQDRLEELVRGNVVYEPKPGYYRTV